jgi:hypothetical protein
MTEATSRPISRRTVAKGAAWTTPVILGGVAAPAYASSGGKPTLTGGAACKIPGNSCKPFLKGYRFPFTITNQTGKDIWLYAPPSISTGGVLPLGYGGARVLGVSYGPGANIPIPNGTAALFELSASGDNSANAVFTFTVSFAWGHTADPAQDGDHQGDLVTATVSVEGTPPNCDVVCDKN